MTPELVEAVRARLDEDEQLALAAERIGLDTGWPFWVDVDDETDYEVAVAYRDRFTPASVLRTVAADRRVLDRHSRSDFGRWCGTCHWCSDTNGDALQRWPCPDLLDLADRYGIEIEETDS